MKFFLRLKHWQLFSLLFTPAVLFQFFIMGSIVSRQDSTAMFYFFSIMMVLFVGVFFGWFYALGVNLHKKLPLTVSMNVARFRIFLFIPVAYMLTFALSVFCLPGNMPSEELPNLKIIGIGLFLHLFSMFCIFYCLYFIAKALKAVEWQKPVTFNDFAGEFFMIWMFPVGVWIIQPRINKLFSHLFDNNQVQHQ